MTHRSRLFAVDISESCVYSFHTLVTHQSEIRQGLGREYHGGSREGWCPAE